VRDALGLEHFRVVQPYGAVRAGEERDTRAEYDRDEVDDDLIQQAGVQAGTGEGGACDGDGAVAR